MKKLFLIMALVVIQPAMACDMNEPVVNEILTTENFSLLDVLFSVPVLTPLKPARPPLFGFETLSKENLPNCPVQRYFYNCVATSPSSLGIGYSSSKFEAAFEALVNCDLGTPDSQSCKVAECV